jgi:nucleotide-binding universal stress UspA family protein
MANTILVPTDFSVNSKGGIRFALQLASQTKTSLVFYHCTPYMKPTRWSDATYDAYVKEENETARQKLVKFIKTISPGIKKSETAFVVQQSPDVQQAIVDYAREMKASAICMSSRGAGRLRKIIGTHASGIINASAIPVFVIPKNYRRNPVTHILYASDLNQIGQELKQVRDFAKRLNAKVSVYHYDYLADVDEAKKKLEQVAKRYKRPDIKFIFQKFNIDQSLGQHLLKDVRRSKAALAVLFTNQKRGWFDKLFLSSKSVEVAFESKVPLMVLPKNPGVLTDA